MAATQKKTMTPAELEPDEDDITGVVEESKIRGMRLARQRELVMEETRRRLRAVRRTLGQDHTPRPSDPGRTSRP